MSDAAAPTSDRVLLQAAGLTRRFGGLAAVQNVSIELRRGEVHAVIGTNGAGKSTLVNMLSGELAPSDGTIRLGRRRHHALVAAASARAPASAAATSAPTSSTSSACSRTRGCRHRPPISASGRSGRARAAARAAARSPQSAIDAVGLTRHAGEPAGILSHGGKRQLEIAMCLATRPQVLLLDEPLAGMGAEETERMLAPARRAEGRARGAAGRARHGRGVPDRRPHHGDGQRRGHRDRRAGRDPPQRRRARRLPRRGCVAWPPIGCPRTKS